MYIVQCALSGRNVLCPVSFVKYVYLSIMIYKKYNVIIRRVLGSTYDWSVHTTEPV